MSLRNNPKERKAYMVNWNKEHPNYHKKRYKADPEKYAKYARDWGDNNPEKRKSIKRKTFHKRRNNPITDAIRRKKRKLWLIKQKDELTDYFIINQLTKRKILTYMEIKNNPEVIEMKRFEFQIKRLIKEKTNDSHERN